MGVLSFYLSARMPWHPGKMDKKDRVFLYGRKFILLDYKVLVRELDVFQFPHRGRPLREVEAILSDIFRDFRRSQVVDR